MFSALAIPFASDCVANNKPVPAFYREAEAMDIPRFPTIGDIGTGGLNTGSYYQGKSGYKTVEVVKLVQEAVVALPPPFASLMEGVQAGFGRTMSRLPEVFGVSRQTLYNWLSGEKIPKEQHRAKLHELAAAAKVFQTAGFKPNSATLDRTVASGKSLLELIGEGGNGEEFANKLLRIVKHGSDAKAKLDDILGDRKLPHLSAADMGALHLDGRS